VVSKIYLISPPKIEIVSFKKELTNLLKTGLVRVFQLRLKDYHFLELKKIALEINTICQEHNCLFILNDNLQLALESGFDGVHIGQQDLFELDLNLATTKINLRKFFKLPKDFILGVSCYDSLSLALDAERFGASYVSFGAFFPTQTKRAIAFPKLSIIKEFNLQSSLPVVAIGGINNDNYHHLVNNGADFLAVVSYIWQNQNPICALNNLCINPIIK